MPDSPPETASVPLPAAGKAGPVFAGHVAFENVSYAINNKQILTDINLKLESGRVACLLGASGCGKTTLLRLAAGILRPQAGRILLDGLEISGPRTFVPPERRNMGLVFQDFALFPHMTALENVAYGLYALRRDEALRVAGLILERVGLSHAEGRMPTSLSGGEQQRVALARALVPRPQVVLLDEPFSGLDQHLKEQVRDETLGLLRETRATALLVTHDADEALAFADHIHVMQSGKLAQSGPPEALIKHPANAGVARFFRHYNTLTGKVHNGGVRTPLGAMSVGGFRENELVEVLAPPHSISIVAAVRDSNATIVENRDMGTFHRIIARLHANSQILLIHGRFQGSGEVCLALDPAHTHVFKAQDVGSP
jgi:iron(III) transport system ATP-binding protein